MHRSRTGIKTLWLLLFLAGTIVLIAGCMAGSAGDTGEGSADGGTGGGSQPLLDGGELSGTYDTDLTLDANTLYTVTGTVTMRAVLTIEPGAVLEFEAGTYLNINDSSPNEGRLRAIGTPEDPIIFRGTTASSGFWRGLLVQSSDTLNRVEYVEISHAGSGAIGGQLGSIVLDGFPGGALAVVNATIETGLGNGLVVEDGATLLEFATNRFGDLAEAPVRIVPDQVAKLDTLSTFASSNADNRIAIDEFGSLSVDAIWVDPGVPFSVTDELVVGASLTLSPGIELQFDGSVRLRVNTGGALIADASGSDAIRFVGSIPLPGWWRGIQIDSDDSANIMDNVEIRHAGELDGMSGSEEANLYLYGGLENAALTLRNSVLADGAAHGVAYDSNTNLTDGTNGPSSLSGVTFSNIGDDLPPPPAYSDYAEL